MKKAIKFSEFRTVQRMTLNQFNRWIESIYTSAFADGLKEGEKELDEAYVFTDDELSDLLLSVPGIGKENKG